MLVTPDKREHVLACISAAPHSEIVIDVAKAESLAHDADFTAVLVEDDTYKNLSVADRRLVKRNVRYAESLGADIETLSGNDVAGLITEFAKMTNVTQIVLDRSTYKTFGITWMSSIPEKIGRLLPDVDLHIIPDHSIKSVQTSSLRASFDMSSIFKTTAMVLLIMIVTTMIGFAFDYLGFDENSIIPLYSLAVLLCCMEAPNWVTCLISTLATILIFNFFFAYPGGSFTSVNPANWITYIVMFITSLTIGFLASSLRQHSEKAARSAYREKVLFDTNALLQKARTRDEIIQIMLQQISKLTQKNAFYYKITEDKIVRLFENNFLTSQPINHDQLDKEYSTMLRAWQTESMTGATTLGDKGSTCIYIPSFSNDKIMGIMGIQLNNDVLDPLEAAVARAIMGKGAMAGENIVLAAQMEEARAKAINQELKTNLLRAISHDLRTPLTSISGNLDTLLREDKSFTSEQRTTIYQDAYGNAMSMISMVENLLSASRMEDGDIDIHPNIEILDDIVSEAVNKASRNSRNHPIDVESDGELLIVNADTQMIVRVLNNLLTNAIEYTPEGTRILVSMRLDVSSNEAVVSVIDEGPGMDKTQQEHLFEMFSNSEQVKDARRSMGLGLYLCRKIIEAHGGTINFEPNQPTGSSFTFRLPIADLSMIHE